MGSLMACIIALRLEMVGALRSDFVDTYEKDGFVHQVPVLSSDEVGKLRTVLDQMESQFPDGRFPAVVTNPHLEHPEVWRFVKHPVLLKTAALLEGIPVTELRVMGTVVFAKYPEKVDSSSKRVVVWHQDTRYWALTPQKVWTSWLAVEASTEANGCVQMMPQMHRKGDLGHLPHPDLENSTNPFVEKLSIPEESLGPGSPVCAELAPGEMSVHSGWTPHRSRPNLSNKRRLGLAIHWIPANVTVGPRDIFYEHEWRLPVDPSDVNFPPKILQFPGKPKAKYFAPIGEHDIPGPTCESGSAGASES
eukprot:CAMPEP_0172679496 /NCGR_PEP_ID=MMETSP1074-20121228/16101_1 /TAXON_ID=2916 /ORGANISM="Ceratium fusus, Strain PA161109" /LENGTH=305 /DNA_ID=CAMNT_0013497677 /DNA_START=67 /DNA_END=984 /DNA_ORIENTATION=+